MNEDNMNKVINSHSMWLEGRGEGERADLSGADLRCADLRCADLRCADLRCADLRCADLISADLSGANMIDVNLSGANLRDAKLHDAKLRCAELSCADLRGADLISADLRGANMIDVNLSGANLRDAKLHGANLRDAELHGANLHSADLILLQADGYTVYAQPSYTRIGCQYLSNDQWRNMTSDHAEKLNAGSGIAWDRYSDVVIAIMDALDGQHKQPEPHRSGRCTPASSTQPGGDLAPRKTSNNGRRI